MNYIELINNFWELDEQWQFTCCETRLYFYLVKTANRLGWVDNWTHSDDKASGNVGVSENSLKTARNKLIQSGLIAFQKGGKYRGDKNRYQILTPKPTPNLDPYQHPNLHPKSTPLNKHKLNQTNTPPKPQGETADIKTCDVDNLEYQEQTPQPKYIKPKKEIDLSFVADDFKPIIRRWLAYKATKGQTYKSADSMEVMYRKLLKISKNSSDVAVEIIEDAMAKNYSGFFEPKNPPANDQGRIPQTAIPTGTEGYTGTI